MQEEGKGTRKLKILLAVPSKARADVLAKYTYPWASLLPFELKIFVEPQDKDKYYPKFPGNNVVVLLDSNKGLGYAKSCIKKYAETYGYDLIFKLDDDIQCFTDFRKRLKPEQCAEFLTKLIPQFIESFEKHPSLSAISFPYNFEMYDKFKFLKTKRIQTAYIVRTEFFSVDPEISVFEDFAVGLNILAQGGKIMKYGMTGIECGVKVGGGEGGHQSFDRAQKALEEQVLLRKIYPPLGFRKVDKPWKYEPDIASVKL
jgi:TET-associated glycosyltransferase-like protein